ncbi:hypothetical protein E2562_015175 [Oryza meyeriana var. granulata]|uniref:DUF834 domain-containing protein n=1 Tax=Oryza meyeriana var. granulata TaxID=110450 RepID=A0A6G1EWN6_9ORYZ|nr:hypothetical protein E2562_015175 [Oryza meyeriana var. granulata]
MSSPSSVEGVHVVHGLRGDEGERRHRKDGEEGSRHLVLVGDGWDPTVGKVNDDPVALPAETTSSSSSPFPDFSGVGAGEEGGEGHGEAVERLLEDLHLLQLRSG